MLNQVKNEACEFIEPSAHPVPSESDEQYYQRAVWLLKWDVRSVSGNEAYGMDVCLRIGRPRISPAAFLHMLGTA